MKDGGSAFPTRSFGQYGGKVATLGMTLRDYFAAQALVALVQVATTSGSQWAWTKPDIAQMAYEQADAMLEARKA